MAAGTLPAPGTEFGACAASCAHRDCEQTRAMSAAACNICSDPIGYGARFYLVDSSEDGNGSILRNSLGNPFKLAHADCLEARA